MRNLYRNLLLFSVALSSALTATGCLPVTSQSLTVTPATAIKDPPIAAEQAALEQEVTFVAGDLMLAGTLTLPSSPGPHPVVVTITGSGPQDRDNAAAELPEYRPYRQIATALAAAGIASLRFDDPGVGNSPGDISAATPNELAVNVEAALTYLARNPELDRTRVGLLGHSEGASIAAIIAARNPEISAVVVMAGPAMSGAAMQAEILGRMNPAVAEQEARVLELVTQEKWEELEEQLTQWTLEQLRAMPEEGQAAIGDLEAAARTQASASINQVYRNPRYLYTMSHDPLEEWRQVQAPVLALYAQHDALVPAGQHKPALELALREANNPAFVIDIVPGVNHLFLPDAGGTAPNEWATLSQQVPEDLIVRIVSWFEQYLG